MAVELLAPGGSVDAIKAAIVAGADAVYCGLDKFNARNRAENITLAGLNGIIHLAHQHDCKLFLTLNIIIVENEIPALIRLLNKLVNTSVDGVIVQDLGVFYLLRTYFPTLTIHASTQLTTHNEGQVRFLKECGARRVNLCRELSLPEIRELTAICHDNEMATEVFVHGSLCLGFSGLCYLSSVRSGNSGNRGRCSQPCRDRYATTGVARDFPLNLKDNSAYGDIGDLIRAGVDSLKIEGRIKKFHYVHTVVHAFKKQIMTVLAGLEAGAASQALYSVFNRDFSNGFLRGEIGQDMFIDNPRDYSALHRAQKRVGTLEQAKRELYDLKTEMINEIRLKIDRLNADNVPLVLKVSGTEGEPLKVDVLAPAIAFSVSSKQCLVQQKKMGSRQLGTGLFLEKFKAINDTAYVIARLERTDLGKDLFLPFRELTEIKQKIVMALCDGRKPAAEVTLPRPAVVAEMTVPPALSLLVSSPEDIHLGAQVSGDVYVELPSRFQGVGGEYLDIFKRNKNCIPWFPAVLIGQEYRDALEFLAQVRASRIVTNNTGIALAAMEQAIPWLAGPQLNTANSWAVKSWQERSHCVGAFISTELSRQQMQKLRRPEGFELHTSIYHPLMLMVSRQCLLQQVTGCEKKMMDVTCLGGCARSAVIARAEKGALLVNKRVGHYHALYHDVHFLNTDVLTDLSGLFSGGCVDLRQIATQTQVDASLPKLVELFGKSVQGDGEALVELHRAVGPTTNSQYQRGI